MRAMVLNQTASLKENRKPLDLVNVPVPTPKKGEVLIKVSVCGVCHTEIDEIEGRMANMKLPVIPGHQVVGTVAQLGEGASRFNKGDRVGVAWIFFACGHCKFCQQGNENLCNEFKATGMDANGGYAEYMTIPEEFVHAIPNFFSDTEVAPLLCAGAIGYRSLRLAHIVNGDRLGLTGFGASAHLVLKLVRYLYPKTEVSVFARKEKERRFALELGAVWAGNTTDRVPKKLDAIIDTTPVWKPVVEALGNLERGGRLVINAIRKEGIDQGYLQNLSYHDHLWMEREVKSVANIARKDVSEFLDLAAKAQIRPTVETFPLEEANRALLEMKEKHIKGAKVLEIN